MLNIILATVLIPLNALALFLIQRFFLNFLNQIIKNAEAIFMHFPVNILIENTYLTSYFNSKLKQGKWSLSYLHFMPLLIIYYMIFLPPLW